MRTQLFTAILLTSTMAFADDSARPEEINVGGASVKTDGCCLAWKPEKAAEITGTYQSVSITDGSSTLEIKAAGEGDDILLTGKIVTKWADGSECTITFTHGDLSVEKGDPNFTASRGIITGWFVQFVRPEVAKAKPRPALILGGDVYVRKE
jgi:hypothetical protein